MSWEIRQGDALELLRTIPDAIVQTCVTSPPYWGLRDYGTAQWKGGHVGCDHSDPKARREDDRKASTLCGGVATIAAQDAGARVSDRCRRGCGARRVDSQLGLEPTPEAYVSRVVEVFRRDEDRTGRNRRSVWTVTSEPFPEAHFAVMPQALVEPCILAGSKPGDLVLDHFAGSGTVGVVALRHGRHFLGLELNAAYCEMARRRIAGPLFAEQGA